MALCVKLRRIFFGLAMLGLLHLSSSAITTVQINSRKPRDPIDRTTPMPKESPPSPTLRCSRAADSKPHGMMASVSQEMSPCE